MTAEVVVMNKTAVALAADSAVTSTAKVFNSAEKLYMLIPGRPIGLMVYNNAEFMQLPWETIVKKYRIYNKDRFFNTIQEYAGDFLDFLGNSKNGLYTDEEFEITFSEITHHYLLKIASKIDKDIRKRIEDKAKRISQKEISNTISYWINWYYQKWNKGDNQYSDEDVAEILKGLEKYKDVLNNVIKIVFGQALLSRNDTKKIKAFCLSLFYKKIIIDINSGIVIAGFGDNELYPVCLEYIVENYFCNHLKVSMERTANIGPKTIGWVIPFAQEDIVKNLLDGTHPDFEDKLSEVLNDTFGSEAMDEINETLKGLRKDRKDKIITAIEKIKNERQNKILQRVQEDFKKYHTDSILQTVAILPKDELAKMAESLVNITSFMRRVSMEIETVGGPIDVAVISKKDGFVWIKRKHYFDAAFNPHFNNLASNGGAK